ncbi:MAG: hypothetical protein OEZ68_06575 [Gammaproteobacteria bacterium]|nr:hypothetical protein [Gammaproteobacteria bacterium]MDH5800455.1 hypothetical protein [Gammaproteobacteria bacterium]
MLHNPKAIITLLLAAFAATSATASAPDVLDRSWEAAWNRVVNRALVGYLQQYKNKTLAEMEPSQKRQTLEAINQTLLNQISWATMGPQVSAIITQHCDAKTLSQMERYFLDKSQGLDSSVRTLYNDCIRRALKATQELTLAQINAATPNIEAIIKTHR